MQLNHPSGLYHLTSWLFSSSGDQRRDIYPVFRNAIKLLFAQNRLLDIFEFLLILIGLFLLHF